MSHILSALLITRGTWRESERIIAELNEWIGATHSSAGRLVSLTGAFAPRGHCPQFEVYGVTINYAELAEFRKQIEAKPWDKHGTVQLVISCEHDDGVQLLTCFGTPEIGCCWDERK